MNLLDQFNSLTLQNIDAFVTEGQEENLLLDFKTLNRADLSHADDKKNLAKALSGFANSSGGIIIWGVEARKNSSGVDCASAIKHISSVPLSLTRLNEFTGTATSPLVEGVQHRIIKAHADDGFAITIVPESIAGPHMAKFGEDRYYKRSGASFYRMEHFDLEDMFGRRKKPKLTLSYRVTDTLRKISIVIGIQNEGRGTAKAPYLSFNVPDGFSVSQFGVDGNMNEGLTRLPHEAWHINPRFGGNSTVVIHPGVTLDVAAIDSREGFRIPPAIHIDYSVTADDTQLNSSSVDIKI